MAPPVYTFDHGLDVPVRTALYQAIRAQLADLVQGDPPVTETAYGPFLREVRPLPVSLDYVHRSRSADLDESDIFLGKWVPVEGPAVAVWIAGLEFPENASAQWSETEIDVRVYFSTANYNMDVYGVLFQEHWQEDRRKDPGINAVEDLVVSRIHGQGLVLASDQHAKAHVRAVDDVGILNRQLWRAAHVTVRYGYRICLSRDALPIDGAIANHTVPADAGSKLYTQGVEYNP